MAPRCPRGGGSCYHSALVWLPYPAPRFVITENPMSPQERRSVASLALLYMTRMLGLFMVLPLLALYAADMPGATPFLLGLALGAYGLTQALLQVPLGWLSDRVGRKPVIVAGLLLFGLGSVVAAQADTVGGIVLGRVLQGAGAIASTLMALLADLTREEQRTKAMALVGISIGLAFALAMVLGPLLAARGGLPTVFWFTALLALAGIALVLLRVPAPAAQPAISARPGRGGDLLGRSLFDSALARLYFGVFTLHFVLMACFLVVPGMLETGAGVDRAHHWQVYLPVLLLSLAGMAVLMRTAERGGRPRTALLVGIGCIVLALALFGLAAGEWLLYTGLWLFFVGFNYLEATLPSAVSKTASVEGRGTAMGLFSTSQFLGAFAGGAVGGWLLQAAGVWALGAACLLLTALWGVGVLRAPRPAPLVEPAAGT